MLTARLFHQYGFSMGWERALTLSHKLAYCACDPRQFLYFQANVMERKIKEEYVRYWERTPGLCQNFLWAKVG